ncbi:MAG TPA: methyltransferase domain-containing protein [Actinokineospora sp.]|nr:methyltransferase domain-containing protein [Actinokineospora sp.]
MTTTDLAAYYDRLEARTGMRETRQRSYALLDAPAGATIVDIGCGAGHAAAELAALGYRPIGVDVNAEALDIARQRLPGHDFHLSSADALPLADGSVHGYRAVRVLHYLADVAAVLREAHRVLASGRRAVLVGHDNGMAAVDCGLPQSERIVRAAETYPASAGRHFRTLLLDAGFTDVSVRVHTEVMTDHAEMSTSLGNMARAAVTANACTQAEADEWLADLAERDRRDRFLIAWPRVFAVGTRA